MADPVYITIEEETIELIEAGPQGPAGPQGDPGEGIAQDYVDALDNANNPSASNPVATMADVADELTADQFAAIQGANAPTASNAFATIADVPNDAADIGAEPARTTATQQQAEDSGGTTVYAWTAQRIHQAIAYALGLWKSIAGQSDIRTDLTPADGATATLNCALGNAFKVTAPDTGAGMDFTIALSNVPAGSKFFAVSVDIVVGTNVPTITVTGKGTNVTAPTLTASRHNIWILSTWDNGTTIQINDGGKF